MDNLLNLIPKPWLIGLVAALIVGALGAYKLYQNGLISSGEKIGRAETVIENQGRVISNVQTANDARNEADERRNVDPDADCMLNARNEADC